MDNKEVIIKCECGTHLLRVGFDDEGKEFYMAMFYYGIGSHKRGFLNRIKVAWNYLRTGKMFSDQLCLHPDEAKMLADFINTNK